jgi:2-hydroxy-3-keto-5-methylthiopentenyl-1-phosphate phosphatase
MRLAGVSVFLDFDGTISLEDTGVYLLEHLAAPAWMELERRYVAGEIGSRECMLGEWASLPRDRRLVEETVAEVRLDEGFLPLVEFLRVAGAEVCILSDGFGFRAEEVGRALGLRVVTNAVDWESWTVRFPHEDLACECAECGACKRAPIRLAAAGGRTTVLVGDGASDVKAATVADLVFATGDLAAWCERNFVAFEPFERLADVHHRLEELSLPLGPSSAEEVEEQPPAGVVGVGVDEDDRLPGTEDRRALMNGQHERRADESR